MTLTAITKNLSAICPSLEIDKGLSRDAVLAQVRQVQKSEELFCPHCYRKTKQWLPVRFRGTVAKRVHFAHTATLSAEHSCAESYGESEKHLFAKIAIADSLRQQPDIQEFSVDKQYIFFVEREGRRKPDILITFTNGAIEAHEIQVSAIALDDLKQRTQDLKLMGVPRVTWYLYGKNYTNPDIRNWLDSQKMPFYRLWFEDDEFYRPRWQLGKAQSPTKKKEYSKDGDRCHVKTPKIDYSNFDLSKLYQWKGNNDKLTKHLNGKKLRVLYHDGAVANCAIVDGDITSTNVEYINWIWLKDLKPV